MSLESTPPRHLITKHEAAGKAGVSPSTWDRLVKSGRAPQPIRFTQTCVRWDSHALDTWIAQGCPPQNGGPYDQ